jgi:hypothetical protein
MPVPSTRPLPGCRVWACARVRDARARVSAPARQRARALRPSPQPRARQRARARAFLQGRAHVRRARAFHRARLSPRPGPRLPPGTRPRTPGPRLPPRPAFTAPGPAPFTARPGRAHARTSWGLCLNMLHQRTHRPSISHGRTGYLQRYHGNLQPLRTCTVRMPMGISHSPPARARRCCPQPRGSALFDARRNALQPPPPSHHPGDAREYPMVCKYQVTGQNLADADLFRVRCNIANLRARVGNACSLFGIVCAILSGLPFEISQAHRQIRTLHEQLKVNKYSKLRRLYWLKLKIRRENKKREKY